MNISRIALAGLAAAAVAVGSAAPSFAASDQENQAAIQNLQSITGAAVTAGSLGGTAAGAVIGCVVGGVATAPTIVFTPLGCATGAITGAGIGAVVGTIVAGGPALIATAVELVNTLQAPAGSTHWAVQVVAA